MILSSSHRLRFWFPRLFLLGLIACLVDSVFFATTCGMSKGNKHLQLVQNRGLIAATLHHETHDPATGPLAFGGERIATYRFAPPRFSPSVFPAVSRSGLDEPSPSKWWKIRVPRLFLIAVYLLGWFGTHRWWQRRKADLHAAPPP